MASVVTQFPAPEIVGPYSRWPREKARAGLKKPAVATAIRCLGPILV